MHVEVNEANIDRYQLVQLTGNSREDMLSAAADAATKGHVLSCNVPDDQVIEQNVFDVYEGEHVDPRRLNACGYEKREIEGGGEIWVCIIHGKSSRYDVSADSRLPCIQVDPEVKPDAAEFNKALRDLPKECSYLKVDDPSNGTTYVCGVHGQPSKHDVTRLPNLPCLAMDPL
jgi:hypothetical protein